MMASSNPADLPNHQLRSVRSPARFALATASQAYRLYFLTKARTCAIVSAPTRTLIRSPVPSAPLVLLGDQSLITSVAVFTRQHRSELVKKHGRLLREECALLFRELAQGVSELPHPVLVGPEEVLEGHADF